MPLTFSLNGLLCPVGPWQKASLGRGDRQGRKEGRGPLEAMVSARPGSQAEGLRSGPEGPANDMCNRFSRVSSSPGPREMYKARLGFCVKMNLRLSRPSVLMTINGLL